MAILLSILLPSLQKARERTIRAVCLSNIAQLYRATIVYSKENNSHLLRGNKYLSENSNLRSESFRALDPTNFYPFVENYLGGEATLYVCPNRPNSVPKAITQFYGKTIYLTYTYMVFFTQYNPMVTIN